MGSLMSGLGWHVFHHFPSRRQCSHLTAHPSATEDQRTPCPLGPAARSMAGYNIQQGRHTAGWIRIRKYVQRWAEIIRSCKDLFKIQVNRPACFCLELNVETSTTLSHPCFQQTVVKIQQTRACTLISPQRSIHSFKESGDLPQPRSVLWTTDSKLHKSETHSALISCVTLLM